MLKIIITGLILLVPDTANRQLHLLLLQMDASHPGANAHVPYLRYATQQGVDSVFLAGWQLDLHTLAAPGASNGPPPEVIDLRTLLPRGIPRKWIEGAPPGRVQSRITLPWPDSMGVDSTAGWELRQGRTRRDLKLTNRVTLTYDVPNAPPSTWTLTPLRSDANPTTIAAYRPGGAGDTIRIDNLPRGKQPDLSHNDQAIHFQGYVDLMRSRFPNRFRFRPRLFPDKGLSPFNCMIATAPIDS